MKANSVFLTGGMSGLGLEIAKEIKEINPKSKIYTTCSKPANAYPQKNQLIFELVIDETDLRSANKIDILLEAIENLSFDLIILNHNVSTYKKLSEKNPKEIEGEILANILASSLILNRLMKKNGPRDIIFILSHICFMFNPGFSIYRASKSFLDSLSKNLAFEYPGINFIRAYPGAIDTNFQDNNNYNGLSIFKKSSANLIAKKILNSLTQKRDYICFRDRIIRFIDAILPFSITKFLYKAIIKNEK